MQAICMIFSRVVSEIISTSVNNKMEGLFNPCKGGVSRKVWICLHMHSFYKSDVLAGWLGHGVATRHIRLKGCGDELLHE